MPRKFETHSPDWIDVNTQITALAQDWGLVTSFRFTVERDYVVCICTTYLISASPNGSVVCQAIVRRPLKSKPESAVMAFTSAYDCWHQMDRGVLGARSPVVSHDWNGRPNIGAKRTQE